MNEKAKWFKKGQNSILRKNKSGCCCIINDDGKVISVCGAHQEWLDNHLIAIETDKKGEIMSNKILEVLKDLKIGDFISDTPDCCFHGIGGRCNNCKEIYFECVCGKIFINCKCGEKEVAFI